MLDRLKRVAAEHGERVLETPGNPISIGVTLAGLAGTAEGAGGDGDGGARDDGDASTRASDVSFFGSMLFSRAVSGTRVVAPGKTQVVGGVTFEGFGASHDAYPTPYFTAAAALGTTKRDADAFCERLGKCFADHARKMRKKRGGEAAGGGRGRGERGGGRARGDRTGRGVRERGGVGDARANGGGGRGGDGARFWVGGHTARNNARQCGAMIVSSYC
jgi:O-phospho-L-seryl-tRNASec:L-selenocysteinyl-tRNA synthase